MILTSSYIFPSLETQHHVGTHIVGVVFIYSVTTITPTWLIKLCQPSSLPWEAAVGALMHWPDNDEWKMKLELTKI